MKTRLGMLVMALLLMIPCLGAANYVSGSLLFENPSAVWFDLDLGIICPQVNYCGVNTLLFEAFAGPKMQTPWLEVGLGWGTKYPNLDIGAGVACLGDKLALFTLGGIYNPEYHFALFGKAIHSVSLYQFCNSSCVEDAWDVEIWLQICNTFSFYFKDAYACKTTIQVTDASFRCECPCFFEDIIVGYRSSSIDICEVTEWDSCFQSFYLGCSWEPCKGIKIIPKLYIPFGSLSECTFGPFFPGVDVTMHF